MQFHEEKDGWRFTLPDAYVQLIQIDFRLGLFLSDSTGDAQLYIETPFHLIGPNTDVVLVPEKASTLAPALPLFFAKVLALFIRRTGHLRIEFSEGYILEVDPNEKFEAWQLGSSSGFSFICTPGGKVGLFRHKAVATKQSGSNL